MYNNYNTEAILKEITFKTARSSGKGGQNVNKVSSKVILNFDINNSEALNEEQKGLIKKKLWGKISKEGIFQISSSKDRSQFMNKKIVVERFFKLLQQAFEPEIERIDTLPTKASKRRRLDAKQQQSEKKQTRKKIRLDPQ